MDVAVKILQSYSGRDKILRTTSYLCTFLSNTLKGKIATDLATFGKAVSASRTVGRLFDDLIALSGTRAYGWGTHEKDQVVRVLQLLINATWQLFYPIEHISWLCDQNILTSIKSKHWATAVTALWGLAVALALLKNFRALSKLQKRKDDLLKQKRLQSGEKSVDSSTDFRKALRDVSQSQFTEYLEIVKNVADLINIVSWLPEGFLWAGKVSRAKNGFLGTVSSLISLNTVIQGHLKARSSTP